MNFLAVALMWMAMQQAPISQDIYEVKGKTEPMDLPAVTEKSCHVSAEKAKQGYCCSSGLDHRQCLLDVAGQWTCTDKSRILLTAEDGTKHCIKFPKSGR